MADLPTPWPKEGLSWREAFARVDLPSLKEQRSLPIELTRGYVLLDPLTGEVVQERKSVDINATARSVAHDSSVQACYALLRSGLLIALAHEDEKSSLEFERKGAPDPKPILAREWNNLRIVGARADKAKQKRQVVYYGLRFLPFLHSPLALETLHGMTLPEAFARYVAGDPELKAAEEAAGVNAGVAAWRPNHHPLFDRIGIFWHASTLAPKAIEDENPSGVLHEDGKGMAANYVARARVAALFELLRAGRLEAVGLDSNSYEKVLPPSFWKSSVALVDFKDGEAFTLNETGKPVLVGSEISLLRKEVVAIAAAPTTDKDWVVHDLGRLPRPTKGEKFKEYVARAWAANLDWSAAIKTRGVAAKIAEAMIDAAGATWEKETLADEIRGHSENREKSAAKKAVPRNDRDLHIARLRSSRPARK
jgi:hypothetical protein